MTCKGTVEPTTLFDSELAEYEYIMEQESKQRREEKKENEKQDM